MNPLRGRTQTVGFATVLATIALIVTWWSWFMVRSVDNERDAVLAELDLRSELVAATLLVGDPLQDDRFVITRADTVTEYGHPIGASGDAVDVDPAVLDAVAATHASRRRMILAETATLLGLIGVCVLMLWQLVRARDRSQREVLLFTGQMTHALKTPLAGLRALLETLQRGRIPDEDMQELLALGLEQVEREEHLVQTLLQTQRSRVTPMRREDLDLHQLMDNLVVHRAGGGIDLHLSGAATATADRDAVFTIVENLLDNARNHGANEVHLTLGQDGRRAWIECQDNGHGFAPERSESLFQAFESAHADNAATHGTGLGLFLCRRLARAMRGDLTGDSAGHGKGARFRLVLPTGA